MKMSNQCYDRLKMVALILMPLITFIAAIGDIWHIPYITQITATLAALDTLLGACLKISSDNYHDRMSDPEPYEYPLIGSEVEEDAE